MSRLRNCFLKAAALMMSGLSLSRDPDSGFMGLCNQIMEAYVDSISVK